MAGFNAKVTFFFTFASTGQKLDFLVCRVLPL